MGHTITPGGLSASAWSITQCDQVLLGAVAADAGHIGALRQVVQIG